MGVAGWPLAGNTGMDQFERQRLVSRAILLERTERVLRDVYQGMADADATLSTVVTFLGYQSRAWRNEAESDAPAR